MVDLLFYTKRGCGLCDRLKGMLEPVLAGRQDVRLMEVNIEGDAGLEARYGRRLPVVEFEGRVVLEGRPDAEAVKGFGAELARSARR